MGRPMKHWFMVVVLLQVPTLMIFLMTRHFSHDFAAMSKECSDTDESDYSAIEMASSSHSEVFQRIDNKQTWLYSAFYDHVAAQSGNPLVRLFGVGKRACALNIFCFFHTDDATMMSSGVIKVLPGEHGVNYPPTHLECPVTGDIRPTHVSVTFNKTGKPANRLSILYPGHLIRNFTVCYSVLHSGFNLTTQLIVSIEMNRILGAEHLMVYNYSISPEVDQILRRYQDDGLVTVYQWPIPTNGSWYFAQITALNDCFYRNRNTSRFVVVLDIDELIIPRFSNTWMELIYEISPQEMDVSKFIKSLNAPENAGTQTGCFIVASSFFYINSTPHWITMPSKFPFRQEEKTNIIRHNLLALSQIGRQVHVFPHKERSKYIARPELVYISGVHEPHEMTHSKTCLYVNETFALTHHYRTPDKPYRVVNDTSALKFKRFVYPRIMQRLSNFYEWANKTVQKLI